MARLPVAKVFLDPMRFRWTAYVADQVATMLEGQEAEVVVDALCLLLVTARRNADIPYDDVRERLQLIDGMVKTNPDGEHSIDLELG